MDRRPPGRRKAASAAVADEATAASSVVTPETAPEDSVRNSCVYSLQSLSPSVSPSGNGCREDSAAIYLSS
ncbi:MAG: hypothetical protein QM579_11950 [Desulfovibrio sp.]|uniref:hypothetical protein n=1 Tax=Desulfovibrio sp. TaxID=885 RepID=UPI0039E47650